MLRTFFVATVLVALAWQGLAKKPNILFILTDDQDLHMESVDHMPYLKVRCPNLHFNKARWLLYARRN